MGVSTPRLGAVFDPLSTPLAGRVAIEASAGTGKTFTITQLYLRLVLERGFAVREILVVTYTKAATAELRDRIRKTLVATRDALRTGETTDDFVRRLLARLPDRTGALATVDRALSGFDEAAIFTIHGFCQRVLAERAFESGVAFDLELVPDQRELAQEVVDDFWRCELYGARPRFVRHALETLTPERLVRLVQDHAGRPYRRIDAPAEPEGVDALEAAFDARHAELRDAWARGGAAVREILVTSRALNRARYKEDLLPTRCEEIAALATEDSPSPQLPDWFARFTTNGIIDGTKQGHVPPSHEVFDVCQRLADAAHALATAYDARVEALRARAIRFATVELARRKAERGVQHYDDLVAALGRALEQRDHGRPLADALRARYGAALIDEFQDTDPFQYEIVRRIYGDSDAPVFLVGDPKQAIYAFRGADVFTYVRAREESRTVGHLDRNWRSTPGLVGAVNALFGGRDDPFVLDAIGFVDAVAAEEPRAPLEVEGDPSEPFRLLLLPEAKPTPKGIAAALAIDATAREVARLVALGQNGHARFGDEPLHGGHIAILVRRNEDGRLMRERLLALGVPSVQQAVDSVFASREAADLERVLAAVADPGRASALRAALATEILGATADDILTLDADEHAWETRVDAFHDYHNLWRTRGFAPMLRELMRREDVARRLLAFDDGERRLTNLLHLAELLQAWAARTQGGLDALVEWLADGRAGARPEEDEQQLRLESDDRLVTIVTVHKSKGLQYEIVFCPFFWDGLLRSERSDVLVVHDDDGDPRATLDLGSPALETRRALARREELAEHTRLLYVALTRARQRCYVVWGRVRGGGTSPLAWLAHRGDGTPAGADAIGAVAERYAGLSGAALRADLDGLVRRSGGRIRVESIAADTEVPAVPRRVGPTSGSARQLVRPLPPPWSVESFTSLAAGLDADRPDYDVLRVPAATRARREGRDRFAFEHGSRAGTCLHAVLERADFVDRSGWSRVVQASLREHGFEPVWEPAVLDMLASAVATPLDDTGAVRLERVGWADRVSELEFHHPVGRLAGPTLAALLGEHEFGTPAIRDAIPQLRFGPVTGFMKGYIDLVFACEGRFWLVDYKSNALGDELDDYAPDRLEAVVAREGHWLQYLIYLVVVHRWLRSRLPDYDYDRHVGGVRYLFLRGLDPGRGMATGVWADRPSRALVEALDAYMEDGAT
jgi:exodeoxyribonuclease V beta subunit